MAVTTRLVDSRELRKALATMGRRATALAGDTLLNEATLDAPVDTGETRRSAVQADPGGNGPIFRTTIEFPTPQAKFTNDGTRPHVIRGNPYLSFFWPKIGRRVTVRRVNHPGNKATHWFDNAVTERRWGDALQRAIRRVMP